MLLGDELRDAIRASYGDARELGAAEDPPEIIPEWDALPLAMQLAFIHVYGAGRQLGASEERKRMLGATDQG